MQSVELLSAYTWRIEMYKLIVFDLDGTLMDTSAGVKYSMHQTLTELGEQNISEELISKFIGPPIMDSFQTFLGYSREKALQGTEIFKKCYQEKGVMMAMVYPSLEDVLLTLTNAGKTLAVATNKTHDNAIKILQIFHIDKYFSHIQGNIPGDKCSKSEIINRFINECQVRKEETVLVGDARQDEEAARNAGIDFVAVTYGFDFSQETSTRDIECVKLCNNPNEIIEFLNEK